MNKVLSKALHMIEPTVLAGDRILYEAGEDAEDFAPMLAKSLHALGLAHGIVCTVQDFAQELTIQLLVEHAVRSRCDLISAKFI